MNNLVKFESGNIYGMRFIGDSNLVTSWICTKRTAKTVTFEKFKNPSDKMNRRIKTYNGVEYVLQGSYSMAPSIKASNIIG